MPDHLHLVHFADPAHVKRNLARLVVAFGRSEGCSGRWHVPVPAPILGPDKLLRQLRYVHLNPCRAGLTRDPLAWPWSTHRDGIGAVYEPWLRLSELDLGLSLRGASLEQAFHRYVSADPSVHPEGSGFPRRAPLRAIPYWGLTPIGRAVVAASPWCSTAKLRERFVALARHQSCHDKERMAQVAGIHPSHVRRLLQRAARVNLGPATLCLEDERLRDFTPWHPTSASRAFARS
jgi:hypothetical protein